MSDRRTLRGVRITFVLPSLGLGGAERQAFLLARHLLQREDADVRLLALSPGAALAEMCQAANVPHQLFQMRHGYRSRLGHLNDLRRFIGLLRRLRAQILLPYCMFQNVLCGLTWRPAGTSVCIWNQRDEGRSRLEPWIEHLAVCQTKCFISNSTHGADFLTGSLRIPVSRVHVVRNGIEIPTAGSGRMSLRERLCLSRDSFLACMVANLHAKKDHATLVAAWRHVVNRFSGPTAPHLLLAGTFGDQHGALVRQVNALSLDGHVHFLGEVRDVNELLDASDLAVYSSVAEGIPNAVLEAMAHALPVVATDYVGIREAVGPEGVPLLARPGDAEDFARRVLTAAGDPELRQRIGREGRRRVADAFGLDRMTAEMTDLILSEWQHSGWRRLPSRIAQRRA
jgi:glycosyltransferase involved in cell wall biosynthesis